MSASNDEEASRAQAESGRVDAERVRAEHVEVAHVEVDLALERRDVDAERLAQQVDVLQEPRGQVGQLLTPERLEVQPLEPAETQPLDLRSGHSRSFRSPPQRTQGSCTPAR